MGKKRRRKKQTGLVVRQDAVLAQQREAVQSLGRLVEAQLREINAGVENRLARLEQELRLARAPAADDRLAQLEAQVRSMSERGVKTIRLANGEVVRVRAVEDPMLTDQPGVTDWRKIDPRRR